MQGCRVVIRTLRDSVDGIPLCRRALRFVEQERVVIRTPRDVHGLFFQQSILIFAADEARFELIDRRWRHRCVSHLAPCAPNRPASVRFLVQKSAPRARGSPRLG